MAWQKRQAVEPIRLPTTLAELLGYTEASVPLVYFQF